MTKLSADGVQWHFNPPSSPHFGGVWERLVQSAKRALKVVAGKQCVNDETLLTFMAEVESLMNGRPLTHVSTDYRDEEALTPNTSCSDEEILTSRQMSLMIRTCVAVRGGSTRKLWPSTSGSAGSENIFQR